MTDGTRAEVRSTDQPDTTIIRIEGEITSGSEKPTHGCLRPGRRRRRPDGRSSTSAGWTT